LTLVF